MTNHYDTTSHHYHHEGGGGPEFATRLGLRRLLARLDAAGPGAWAHDQEASALMDYTARKYEQLAARHGLDRWEAASAAYEAMQTLAVRIAEDPWAVITRAVQVTCIAEERANGLLCSTQKARRPRYNRFHDATRFSEYETPVDEYHPAFICRDRPNLDPTIDHHHDNDNDAGDDGDGGARGGRDRRMGEVEVSLRVRARIADAIRLLVLLGWEEESAEMGTEYVCSRLIGTGSRATAFEALRRDWQPRILFDLPGASWLSLLRVLLGNPDPAYRCTRTSHGVLVRLLVGEPLASLLADDRLVTEIVTHAPCLHRHHRRNQG